MAMKFQPADQRVQIVAYLAGVAPPKTGFPCLTHTHHLTNGAAATVGGAVACEDRFGKRLIKCLTRQVGEAKDLQQVDGDFCRLAGDQIQRGGAV